MVERAGTLARAWARVRWPDRADLAHTLRITLAAVASYVVGSLLFPEAQPLLAPLTAMLVVQVTPVSLLASGLDRVVAVTSGVALAVVFSTTVPLEWWSLGALILVALLLGQVLRLRSNLLEVAISAMLVLGVGSLGAEAAAWERITETLVGAVVGIAVNLLVPPKVASADAGAAVDEFADSLSALLTKAADQVESAVAQKGDLARLPPRWLHEARLLTHEIPDVEAAVAHAEEGRRLNVRAAFTNDAGPGLRQGMESLEHTAISVRSMFRSVLDASPRLLELDRGTTDDLALGLAQTMREMAAGVDAFGALVRAEAMPRARPGDVAALADAREGLHEARARLEELMVSASDPRLVELSAVLLTTVRRMLREMDLDERIRRQIRLGRGPRGVRRRPRPDVEPVTRDLPVARPITPPEPMRPVRPDDVSPDAETEVFRAVRRDDD